MKWKIEHTEESEGNKALKILIYDIVFGNPADVSSTILVFRTSSVYSGYNIMTNLVLFNVRYYHIIFVYKMKIALCDI